MRAVYLIGIGGIGMSALARYFKRAGHMVCGYDKTPSELTARLQEEGIPIIFDDDESKIPEDYLQSDSDVLIIFTPAIPSSCRIKAHFSDRGHSLKKRSEVLGDIANSMRGIAVAGTHGKTTTTAILAHLLTHSAKGCNAFLGGIATNYDTNFLNDPQSDLCVIEADEFDRSFHRLHPEIAVITNVDPDHLDIYGNEQEFRKAFIDFAENVTRGGDLFLHESIEDISPSGAVVHHYGFAPTSHLRAENVRVSEGMYLFDLMIGETAHGTFQMPLPGRHNIANALAAIGVALTLGVEVEKLRAALAAFKGVKRRFQTIVKTERSVYIDDYAHHPSEIDAAISSARELYPDRRLTVVFQPHLFSRTKDFMDDFAASLSKADDLILLDIYPARESPMAGVTSEAIATKSSLANITVLAKEDLVDEISGRDIALLLTLGAGDIDRLILPLAELLRQ